MPIYQQAATCQHQVSGRHRVRNRPHSQLAIPQMADADTTFFSYNGYNDIGQKTRARGRKESGAAGAARVAAVQQTIAVFLGICGHMAIVALVVA
jgi:hypothetical protein